jgi:hypothetical protein
MCMNIYTYVSNLYICMHIYCMNIYSYAYTCTHIIIIHNTQMTYIHTYRFTDSLPNNWVIHTHTHTHTHTPHIYTYYVHTYTHTHTHIQIYQFTAKQLGYTHTHAHIYILCTYIHTHILTYRFIVLLPNKWII